MVGLCAEAIVPDFERGKEAAGIFNSKVGGEQVQWLQSKINILSDYSLFTEYRIKETYFIVTCSVCLLLCIWYSFS